jgi:NTE family protein
MDNFDEPDRERALKRSTAIVSICAAFLLLAGGCAMLEARPRVAEEPSMTAPKPFGPGRRPIALVLSGGAARGFAHVGVIRVLEQNGIKPDLIVGSSAGSIVGALYASGLDATELDAALAAMDMSLFNDVVWPRFGVLPGELGLVSGERLRRFVFSRLKRSLIQDFPIRFAAVATDLESGTARAFNSGDASLAVKASTAVPGLMSPVPIAGSNYADGQIAAPIPVQVARRLGAQTVIAVDVIYPPHDSSLTNPVRVLFQAFLISTYQLREVQLRDADIVITPDIEHTSGQLGIDARARLVQAGEKAAREALPRIREALERRP